MPKRAKMSKAQGKAVLGAILHRTFIGGIGPVQPSEREPARPRPFVPKGAKGRGGKR
jgi:hypothetical protein